MSALAYDTLGSYLFAVEEVLHSNINGQVLFAIALVVDVVAVSIPAYLTVRYLKGLVALYIDDVAEVGYIGNA